MLGAFVAIALAQRVCELALELAGRGQLLDDVRAADELALDEDLRDRRPAGQARQFLAETWVGEDVDGRDGCAGGAERLECPLRVAARDEARCSFHEERYRLGLDDVADLVSERHVVPFVLMRSSWIEPSASGMASAS